MQIFRLLHVECLFKLFMDVNRIGLCYALPQAYPVSLGFLTQAETE